MTQNGDKPVDGLTDAAAAPPQFLPPGTRQRHQPPGADVHDSLAYSWPNGYRAVELDLFVPSNRTGPVPCVVWIHGGGWLFGSRQVLPYEWPAGSLFTACIEAGIAVAAIEYRHSREASFPAQLHDAKAAVRYVRQFGPALGIDPDRIAVWGESAGGHLAALVGLVTDPALEGREGLTGPSSAVSAVVDFYGIADVDTMPNFLDNFPQEWRDELERTGQGAPAEPIDVLLADSPWPRDEARRLVSPVHHVAADSVPLLLIHGETDRIVPVSQSAELHDALTAAGASSQLVRVPGADHVFSGTDPMPQIAAGVEFLAQHFGLRE